MSATSVIIDTTNFSETSLSTLPTFSSHEFLPSCPSTNNIEVRFQRRGTLTPEPYLSFGLIDQGSEEPLSSSSECDGYSSSIRPKHESQGGVGRYSTCSGADKRDDNTLKRAETLMENSERGSIRSESSHGSIFSASRCYKRHFSKAKNVASNPTNMMLKKCFISSDRIIMPTPVTFDRELSVTYHKSPGQLINYTATDIMDSTIGPDSMKMEETLRKRSSNEPSFNTTNLSGIAKGVAIMSSSISDNYPKQYTNTMDGDKCCFKCCRPCYYFFFFESATTTSRSL